MKSALFSTDGFGALLQQALNEKVKQLEKDNSFYKEVNVQLDLNQTELEKARKQIQDLAESERSQKDAIIQDLQEQAKDLL